METLTSANTFPEVWQRYTRYCTAKELSLYSDVSCAIWAFDISPLIIGTHISLHEVEIIKDIISTSKMTG